MPVLSLESAVSTFRCPILPPNCKKIPCCGQEQPTPQLTELHPHKFSLRTSGQQHSRDVLRFSILWMFQDHPVNRLNQTGDDMMCCSGILEHYLCWMCRPIEGLMRLGKDWIQMLQSYVILSLELLHEDWIQRLLNQDHHFPLCVQYVEFRIQS